MNYLLISVLRMDAGASSWDRRSRFKESLFSRSELFAGQLSESLAIRMKCCGRLVITKRVSCRNYRADCGFISFFNFKILSTRKV